MSESPYSLSLLKPSDHEVFSLIAEWYLQEWKIPKEKTVRNLEAVTASSTQFQVLFTLKDTHVATAGVYHHVSLLDKEPKWKVFPHWLALVYTKPEQRGRGYGAAVCHFVESHAKSVGIDALHLFTDTAEPLYQRLGWRVEERQTIGERAIVVMKKILQ